MSTEFQQIGTIEPEVVSREMISAAVEDCFLSADCSASRALEIAPDEDIAADPDALADAEETAEVETAEEVSLKNGVYHETRRKLGERFGIPANEIAFIHEADTPAKKATLFKAVNAGRVRVLIGSTPKLGTGVNVQKRLIALHHVDEPWKPAELEQREGRILRQGNIYPEVFIFHYVTERSFDGYMLQTLESKARFISQILAGEVTARTAEDVGDMVLTVAQVKAIASGNPMVQRRIELEVKLVKLDRLRAAYYNNRAAMRADMEELPQTIFAQEAELAGHEQSIRARHILKEDAFHITLKKRLGKTEEIAFDKRERAGAHLRYLADLLTEVSRRNAAGRNSLTEEVGSYCGFKVYIHVSGNSRLAGVSTLFNFRSEIHLRATDGGTHYIAAISESNVGIMQSIDYQLRHIEDRIEQTRAGLEMLRARLVSVQMEADKPWTHAAEYRRLRKEYDATGAALQAEGVEIENNTTFAAQDGDVAEMENSEDAEEAAEHIESSIDELGAHRNPFTGLEEWAIMVIEPPADDLDNPEAFQSHGDNGALSFDFDVAHEPVNRGEEADIFLTPACDDEETSGLAKGSLGADETPSEAEHKAHSHNDDCFEMGAERVEEHSVPFTHNRLKKGKPARKKDSRPSSVSVNQSCLWS